MKQNKRYDYFEAYSKQCEYAQEMALNLKSAIEAKELGTKDLLDALHTIENDADAVNHTIQQHLASDFVVPFERDSMAQLGHTIDDVCDSIEIVAARAYIYCVSTLPDVALPMIGMVADTCGDLQQACALLSKKGKELDRIRDLLVSAHKKEGECDEIYIAAAHDMYKLGYGDWETRYFAHLMLAAIETAMNEAEDAAECLEMLVFSSS